TTAVSSGSCDGSSGSAGPTLDTAGSNNPVPPDGSKKPGGPGGAAFGGGTGVGAGGRGYGEGCACGCECGPGRRAARSGGIGEPLRIGGPGSPGTSLSFLRFRRLRPESRVKALRTSAKVAWSSPSAGGDPPPGPVLISASSHRFTKQGTTR